MATCTSCGGCTFNDYGGCDNCGTALDDLTILNTTPPNPFASSSANSFASSSANSFASSSANSFASSSANSFASSSANSFASSSANPFSYFSAITPKPKSPLISASDDAGLSTFGRYVLYHNVRNSY
jgi:hypothetical protein